MINYISRLHYLQKVAPFIDQNLIKVIIGQRRVGKSYFLMEIMDTIKKQHPDANIIYINKELYEFDQIKTYHDLMSYIETRKSVLNKNYLFIDEVQDIDQFEKALRSLQAAGNYDLYCSGSNAKMLSGDLATYLSGRYVEIKIFSLSYPEFLTFHRLENSLASLYAYIKFGGLPYLHHLSLEDDIVYNYLNNVYHTVLLKDIVARYQIRNVAFLERLVLFLADNVGNIFSAKRISDFLKSQQVQISPNVILNYLSYLTAAFFVFKVPRSDIMGKKIFEVGEKYYFEDLGIRHTIIGYQQRDINKVLENLVYNHLTISGYTITVGKIENKEIDFICTRHHEKMYVQVAYLIPDNSTWEREFGNLLAVNDNFPKLVVSMDEMIGKSSTGIIQLHIRDFLSEYR
ncbi:ATP-binding protein [candidate division KSB1 bacterium]|nr:ATP-binding protein [candidate division KSB1 bacterium]